MKTLTFSVLILVLITSININSQTIPRHLNYQGALKDASGNNVPNGSYTLSFNIYNTPTGGSALWTETKLVSVEDGIFSTLLGSLTALNLPFDEAYWLGVEVGGTELSPRILFTSVPYSRMSLNVPDNSLTAAKISSGQVVKSINGLRDNVNLVAGSNVTLTPSGNDITISSSGGGGGTVTQVSTGAGLTGGPITTTGTISVPNNGITSAMLQNNSVTSAKIVDGTITAADIGNTQVVKSINTLKDDVSLLAGSNITITPSGNNLTISSTAGGLGGTGTTNFLPKFTGTSSIGNSIMTELSNRIGISVSSPSAKLDVLGGQSDLVTTDGDLKIGNATYKLKMGIATTGGNAGEANISVQGGMNRLFIGAGNTLAETRTMAIRNRRVGIGVNDPLHPLHISTNVTDNQIAATIVVTGSSTIDGQALTGYAINAPGYGIGAQFIGGWRGILAEGNGGISSGSGSIMGISATATGTGSTTRYGVYGAAAGPGPTQVGIYGNATGGTTNWAGYFFGNVNVTGTLSKGGGSFKIDHPLDPANKYLYHSFVESPDMMNIYNGNVTTDASGYATISLPEWFEALNKDFRYQLTVIGDFAQAIIADEVRGNQFAIRTDKPNIKVSWQVTGIRKDAFAEKYRIPVEELKQADEIGKYAHPEAFGLPETLGVDFKHRISGEERRSLNDR